MILCETSNIINIATLITAISSLVTGFYLWYDRRARLIVSIEPVNSVYCITIENVGKKVAKNIKISISKEFIYSLPVYNEKRGGKIRQKLLNIQERKFYFAPGVKKYFYLIQCPKSEPVDRFDVLCNEWHERNQYTPFRIDVTYNGWYECSGEYFIDQFKTEALLYKDSLAQISDSMNELLKTQKSMAEELEKISEKINNQNNGKIENEKR